MSAYSDGVLVGDLTADETHIVLLANGHPYAIKTIAHHLKHLTPRISKADGNALLMPATWPAVVQLAHALGRYWHPMPRLQQWIANQYTLRLRSGSGELTVELPEGLTPRSYQVEGARMIADLGQALIFDDPGTGKTITTILGLRERDLTVPVIPALILAPASVVDSWVDALTAWAPDWTVVAWRGPKRAQLAGTADVYVTSYDTARRDADPDKGALIKLKPRSIVLDECHLIKSPNAVRSVAARRLAKLADTRVALSGTPISHHPGDLWPTLAAIDSDSWPARSRYVDRYLLQARTDYGMTILGLDPHREPEFRQTLQGVHRRKSKADVLAELPPKVYSTRYVDLPEKWRAAYDALEKDMRADIPEPCPACVSGVDPDCDQCDGRGTVAGETIEVMEVITLINRLTQIACAPATVETWFEVDPKSGIPKRRTKATLHSPSWKVDALLEVLAERPGSPVVAFASSRQLTMLAGQQAESEGYSVGYIVGGQAAGDRTETVSRFQAGKLDLLCVTTGAGGVGLTLTAARTAVFLQRPWSLIEAAQAEDRLHRIGAERHDSIEIIDIVARDTVDSRIRQVLRSKAGQLSNLLQDPRIAAEILGGTRKGKGSKK